MIFYNNEEYHVDTVWMDWRMIALVKYNICSLKKNTHPQVYGAAVLHQAESERSFQGNTYWGRTSGASSVSGYAARARKVHLL